MVYIPVELDENAHHFFEKLEPQILTTIGLHDKHPNLKEMYVDHVAPHEDRYVVRFKAGHLGNHHKYTVVIVSHDGSTEIEKIQEGRKTFF